MKILIFLIATVALMYLGVLIFVFLIQRKLQYAPTHRDASAKGHAELKPLVSATGAFLGYWRPVENPKQALVLFHGNGGEALDREWIAEVVPEEEYLVILAEYPGYGAKPGTPTQASLNESALALVDEVKKRWGVPLTVIGESLGSGVASYVASQRPVTRLALITPFSSAVDIAAIHYRFLPVRVLMQDKYDSVKALKSVEVPLHIIHGTLDDVIPIEFAKQLFDKYPGKNKIFSEIPGYGHNNISSAVTDSPFADRFRSFLRGE